VSRPEARHGSVVAHLAGCRTKAACPHHDSSEWLTCAEAAVARRGDWRAAAYSLETPIPRDWQVREAPARPVVHGTIWGYRRGCRSDVLCPNRYRDLATCAEMRRRYSEEYRRRRSSGDGRAIEHGTSNGYLLGCRGDDCPGGRGTTCRAARAAYRQARRAANDGRLLVPADEVARAVRGLCDAGLSAREIARRTGTGRATLTALLAGRRARVTRDVAERIAAAHGLLAAVASGETGYR
jgi:hypothetical protein